MQDPKKLFLGIAMVVLGLFAVINGVTSLTDNVTRLIAPRGVILIETVDTAEARALGLSGRESIADDRGMMFVFDQATTSNCFWMKDMQFSIDMIWLDSDKKVVTIRDNVSPDTYPESFCPVSDAKYGLEIGAGQAMELEIREGSQLSF